MAASILHRVSGVANVSGGLLLAGWVAALASGPSAYAGYMNALGSPFGKIVLFGYTLSVFYHLGNGVRHLVWDSGVGFEPKRADFTAVVVFAFAVVASVAVWLIALFTGAF
jgi:succinate dehydrogenase / fumarate reductase cytochrome b subunit